MFTNDQHKRLTVALQEVIGEAMLAVNAGPAPTCLTCTHFLEHQGEVCQLAGQRPPARVIHEGCPAYEEDDIPF